ncbi:MAG: GIDE domain-containing protein [Candidatus Aenigmatarchaeota archaeon]
MSLEYSILTLLFGIFIFCLGIHYFKKKRLIEDIPTSKIRSIAMGLVEIYGKVVPIKDRILKSPLTQTECVYYKYLIEELKKSEESSKWVIIKVGENGTYFYLQDETGSVLVDPKWAEIDLVATFTFESGPGKDPPESVKSFLEANNIRSKDFFGMNKTMRFREFCIRPGDKLYIIGTAGDNPFVKEGWAQSGVEDVMIQKGENIYYISNRSEKEVVKKLMWKSLGIMFIGGLLIIVAVASFIIL